MKNPRISKDKIIICCIVFAVCLFFAAGFRVEPLGSSAEGEKVEAGLLYMMPRDSTISHPFFNEQAARDDLDDPTIMSFPNMDHGFSSVLQNRDEPPSPSLPVYNLKTPNEEILQVSGEPLTSEFKIAVSNPSSSFVKPQLEAIAPEDARGRFSVRVMWMEDDKEQASPFKIDEILKLTGDRLPGKRTELHIMKVDQSYAFFIKQKCGIEELDNLVLSHFRKLSLKRFLNEKDAEELPKTVIIDWRLLR